MRLIAIARSVQPFIKKGSDVNSIYKEIIDNSYLDFISGVVTSNVDFIILVFLTYKISKGEPVNESTISQIKNNLFIFNKIEFDNEHSQIDCTYCDGNGEESCSECDGQGYLTCDECDGSGEVECQDCEGDGVDDEYDTCDNCDGGGHTDCYDCGGEGTTDCSYCRGGKNDCDNCGGLGYVETDEYIPYSLSLYASYNTTRKDEINYMLLRNESFKHNNFYKDDDCLLLYRRDYGAGEGQSEEIDHKYQDESYFDGLVDENIDSLLTKPKSKGVITCPTLMEISEKFLN